MRRNGVGQTLGLVSLVAGMVLAPAGLGAPTYMRHDALTEFYFPAYLTWNANKGAIEWTPGGETEDPGGSPQPYPTGINSYGWTVRRNTGDDHGLLRTDTYTSGPFPRTLHVNVSRVVQVDLFGGPECCNSIDDVELYVDGVLLGGQLAMGVSGMPRPKTSDGWNVQPARLHAELDEIPAGAILTLKIIRHGETRYGMKDPHQSVIKIPYYADEELAFRKPPATLPVEPSGETGSGFALAAWALLGLVVPRAARLRRAGLAMVLGAAFLLAGCAAKPGPGTGDPAAAPETGGHVEIVLVPTEPGVGGSSDQNGSVVGRVQDDLRMPLSEASVFFFDTVFFATTNEWGSFSLGNLPAGAYRMRVDREGYRPLEEAVEVVAGHVSRVEVVLAPLIDRAEGFRPHRHDYWVNDRQPLLEATVYFEDAPSASWTEFSAAMVPIPFPPGSTNGIPPIVLPGTVDVEIELQWQRSQHQVRGYGIGFRANHDAKNVTLLYPRGPGTFHIRTGWEMTDFGHQKYSMWELFVYLPVGGGTGYGIERPSGPITVKATIQRGTLPLEPAHKEFWGPNTTLPIFDKKRATTAGDDPVMGFAAVTLGRVNSITQPSAPSQKSGAGLNYTWVPPVLVPPGTAWLDITMEQTKALAAGSTDWTFAWKGAGTAPGCALDPQAPGFTKATPKDVDRTKLVWTFRIPLGAQDPDPFYAKRSAWCLRAQPTDQNAVAIDYEAGYYGGSPNRVSLLITIVAHRGENEPSLGRVP